MSAADAAPLEAPDAVERELRAAIEHAISAQAGRPLQDVLYEAWYTSWGAEPVATQADLPPILDEALRAAHADSARFEPGWTAVRVWRTGRVAARRNGSARVVDPVDYVCPDRPGLPPRAGMQVEVAARRDTRSAQPGYWCSFGQGWDDRAAAAEQLRLYWNIGPDGAPALVRGLTGALADAGVAYAMKLPSEPAGYARRDACVLFVRAAEWESAAPALRAAHADLAARLAPLAPPLTRVLAPGVGLAEDPPGDESFGSSRCRLVAEALRPALARGERDRDVLLEAIRTRFRAQGIAPGRPHLNPPGERDRGW